MCLVFLVMDLLGGFWIVLAKILVFVCFENFLGLFWRHGKEEFGFSRSMTMHTSRGAIRYIGGTRSIV